MILSRSPFYRLCFFLVVSGNVALAAPALVPIPTLAAESAAVAKLAVPSVTLPKPAKAAAALNTSTATTAKVFKPAKQPLETSSSSKILRPFRLIVPAMGLDIPVVSGTDNDALRLAPGHDPLSALPGETGNCVVASHRNVHGAYFWYLTKVKPGSLITLQTPRETFTYKVVSARVVPDNQTDLLENHTPPGSPARLTLYTCTLPVTPRRFVVVANQIARGVAAPGAFGRPAIVPEITSGPLRLLKDKVLHERYQSLLHYAQKNEETSPAAPRGASDKAVVTP